MQILYIIAGCNGAGKTTASYNTLPSLLDCKEFVNADEIAKGLSPFNPESVSFEAGRIMLNRINELLIKNVDFAFETTLASKTFKNTVLLAQNQGYCVTLLFYWLKSEELAIKRVQTRVSEGGHNIPTEIIQRRYKHGIQNLFNIYLPICDNVMVFDNSDNEPDLVFEKQKDNEIIIYNQLIYNTIYGNR